MTNQTFIAACDNPAQTDEEEVTFVDLPIDDWETRMAELSQMPSIRIPRKANRRKAQVVDALNDAFELIGGAPRLALWADTNPTEFYRIWSKLAPKDICATVESNAELKIVHVLPPGKLDQ
jgi:hypothetical protein